MEVARPMAVVAEQNHSGVIVHELQELPHEVVSQAVDIGYSRLEFVGTWILRMPPPISWRQVQELAGKYFVYSSQKARDEIGYKTRPLDETLKDTVDWLKRS